MSDWQNIRIRAMAHGESIKSIARSTGHARNTIRKYLRSDPPPQQHPSTRISLLTPYIPDILCMLEKTPKITAKRIASILREQYARPLGVGERSIRKFIAKHRQVVVPKEVYIRLVYEPGSQMQIDFKDVFLTFKNDSVKHHLFTARLSHSGATFAKVYRSEDAPSLLDGIVQACIYFCGVPKECVFDNAKTAVNKVYRGRQREIRDEYRAVCGGLGLEMQFAAPAKGNEKGGVEGAHGYIEDNFFRPERQGDDLVEVNCNLQEFLIQDNIKRHQRFAEDQKALRALPARLPDTHRKKYAKINKFAEVIYSTHRYSVPSEFAHRESMLSISSDRILVIVGAEVIAEHKRSFEKHGATLNPMHYINALVFKHRAVERAEVFQHPDFPESLKELLRSYVDQDRDTAGKHFSRIMQSLKIYSQAELIAGVEMARRYGTIDPAAIELILQQTSTIHVTPMPLNMPHRPILTREDLSAYSAHEFCEQLI